MLLFYNDLDNMDKNLLLTAIRASLEAGSEIMSVYTDPNADFEIEKKADNSPLTIADRKSHMVIAARLASTPYPVLSEEGKKIPVEERQSWNELWIVDPLDGTKEFIKRNGEFTVNIAYVKNGKPEAGVIYIPVKEELYFCRQPVRSLQNRAYHSIGFRGNSRQPYQQGTSSALSGRSAAKQFHNSCIPLSPYAGNRGLYRRDEAKTSRSGNRIER